MNKDLEKQNFALKRQLESETLLRVDLENKNKTLREELEFKDQVHQTVKIERRASHSKRHLLFFVFQHLEQIKEQQRFDVTRHDGVHQQYDDKLLLELQQLRAQNDQEILLLREDMAAQYEKRVRFRSGRWSCQPWRLFRWKIYRRPSVVMWNKSRIIEPI